MRATLAVVLIGCRAAVAPVGPGPEPPAPVVRAPLPPAPGFRLPHTFEPSAYRARLAIASRSFDGVIEIDGELREPASVIWLHQLELTFASASARRGTIVVPLEPTRVPGQELVALVAKTPLDRGRWTVSVTYAGSQVDRPPVGNDPWVVKDTPRPLGLLHREFDGEDYAFSMSEPTGARRIFPCIDEPDRKVPWQLTLDVGDDLIAVANSPVVREHALGGKRKRFEFAPTPPLPTYVVAFAVGRFEAVDAGKSRTGVPIRILMPHGHTNEAAAAVEETPRALAALEDWVGMPYPYAKLDLVPVPRLGFGAMENPGLITVADDILRGDPAGPLGGERRRQLRHVITHELAHQWFGNFVTLRWWNDLWLNEGFADWVARRVQASEPDLVSQNFDAIATLEATHPTVRKTVTDQVELDRKFFEQDYLSLGAALSVFEAQLGRERFRTAIRSYLGAHAHGNATTEDFGAALSVAAGRDVQPLLAALVDTPAWATVDVAIRCAPTPRLELDTALAVPLDVCLAYDRDGARGETCTALSKHAVVELPVKRCPGWAMAAGGLAPYRANVFVPAHNSEAVVAKAAALLTPDERIAAFRVAFGLAAKLRAVPMVLSANTAQAAALASAPLLEAFTSASDARRPQLARWITARLAPHAASIKLADPKLRDAEAMLVELVAAAGDTGHDREAIELVPRLRELSADTQLAVVRIAASADRSVAARLLGELANDPRALVEGLSRSRDIVGVVAANLPRVRELDRNAQLHLLVGGCQLARRAEIERLAKALALDAGEVGRAFARCEASRKDLDPTIAALLRG